MQITEQNICDSKTCIHKAFARLYPYFKDIHLFYFGIWIDTNAKL